jgi:hypothetical protein
MAAINNPKIIVFLSIFLALTLVMSGLLVHRIKLQEQLENNEQELQEFNVLLKKFVAKDGPRFVNSKLLNTDNDKQLWIKELTLLHGAQKTNVSFVATNHYQLVFNVWGMSNLIHIADAIDNDPRAGITNLVVKPDIGDIGLTVKLEAKIYE